jgi:hypothetical protein
MNSNGLDDAEAAHVGGGGGTRASRSSSSSAVFDAVGSALAQAVHDVVTSPGRAFHERMLLGKQQRLLEMLQELFSPVPHNNGNREQVCVMYVLYVLCCVFYYVMYVTYVCYVCYDML